MVIVHYGTAGLLVLAALVQLNDPDPLPWVTFYTICGVLVAVAAKGGQPVAMVRYIALGMMSIAVMWFAWVVYNGADSIGELTVNRLTQNMSKENPGNELLKELGGIFLSNVALYALVLRAK